MKKIGLFLFLLCALCAAAYDFKLPPRKILCSGPKTKIENVTLIKDVSNPDMTLALSESRAFLTQVMGKAPKVAKAPVPGSFNIILGCGPLAKKAGIRESDIPQEGFITRRMGNNLYIAGNETLRERGTLNGIYDFFERFCDARFYFPGKNGTLIPRKGLTLPEKIEILDRPDYPYRHLVLGTAKWYEKNTQYDGANVPGITLQKRRWRDGSCLYPLVHSLYQLNYTERFSKSHPEYFALMPDGRRYNTPDLVCTEHFCFSSGIKKEIELDALAYLEGKPAASRNIRTKAGKAIWHWTAANEFHGKKFFGVMPNDYLYWCCCPECAKIAPGGRSAFKAGKNSASQAISNAIWKYAADIARSVKAHGHNCVISLMAYAPYKMVPQVDLPENILVQLALTGGTANKNECRKGDRFLNDWCRKLKSKVFIWTYPGKHMQKNIPGVPPLAHNRCGHWYQERSDRINGALFEDESDYWFFVHLNCYIFLRTAWDNSISVNAVLKEYFDRMFGAGSAEMQKLYDELEHLWCDKVVGDSMDSPLGPLTRIPADIEMWTEIYSPKKLAELDALAARAVKKCAGAPAVQERIRFAAQNLLGPLKEAAQQFLRNQSSVKDWTCRLNETIHLLPYHSDLCEVGTTVKVTETKDAFLFDFRCEEPRMDKIKADYTPERGDLFRDSVVELFLNPSGDRKHYFHFYANSKGVLSESAGISRMEKLPVVRAVKCGITVKTACGKDHWSALFTVPKAALGNYVKTGFPVNFARNRALTGWKPGKDYKENFYHWNPIPGRSFSQADRFGTLLLTPPAPAILKDGDFAGLQLKRDYVLGNWVLWRSQKKSLQNQPVELDQKHFISGGQSVHMKSTGGKIGIFQLAQNLKPRSKYRFSFFVRTKDIPAGMNSGVAPLAGWKPNGMRSFIPVCGTRPWHKVSVDFTTPEKLPGKPWIYIWFFGKGEAWIDRVSITELP